MTNALPHSSFEVIDLSPNIGSEIRAEKQTLLSGEYSREIRALLEQRGVLLMRAINMTDEEQRGVGLFGVLDQVGRAFAHLRHAAGSGRHVGAVHHLDRIHHDQPGPDLLGDMGDFTDVGFGQHLQLVRWQAEPFGAHADLLQRFLADGASDPTFVPDINSACVA